MLRLLILPALACCFIYARAATKCCPGGVCFTDDPPFNDFPLPQCVEDIQPSIRVFTRSNPVEGQNITRNTVPPAFDGSKLTIFFAPGGTSKKYPPWIFDLKDAALTRGDYNVIIIDWEEKSKNVSYYQLFSDSRTIGTEIALIAGNVIATANSDKSRLYCVGHSLGTNVCGHAGMQLKFGRITGLDPSHAVDRDWTFGLNRECADFVDVIHTSGDPHRVPRSFSVGTRDVVGHVDFYVNGGSYQPGCDEETADNYTKKEEDKQLKCNHMRAIDLYLESILTPCFLSRYKCKDSYRLPESCKVSIKPLQSMGFEAIEYGARGIFYLRTRSSKPFCLG